MEAKSVITSPSGDMMLDGPGFHEITGLAWSGRGTIRRVDVSVDGGSTWRQAALQEPVLPIFVVTKDVSAYTKADLFQPGRKTELLRRFSTVAGDPIPGVIRADSPSSSTPGSATATWSATTHRSCQPWIETVGRHDRDLVHLH